MLKLLTTNSICFQPPIPDHPAEGDAAGGGGGAAGGHERAGRRQRQGAIRGEDDNNVELVVNRVKSYRVTLVVEYLGLLT